jgi:hypothetical protein
MAGENPNNRIIHCVRNSGNELILGLALSAVNVPILKMVRLLVECAGPNSA